MHAERIRIRRPHQFPNAWAAPLAQTRQSRDHSNSECRINQRVAQSADARFNIPDLDRQTKRVAVHGLCLPKHDYFMNSWVLKYTP